MLAAAPAAEPPSFQLVEYWARNSELRCTNAVEDEPGRLSAPPNASKAIAPTPPAAPRTPRIRSMPVTSARMPAAGILRVKKSDLA